MKITVHLFARAKDIAGSDAITVTLAEGATVADLRRVLAEQHPRLAALLRTCALAINNDFADERLSVPANAEVALLPPVSGG
jgi:molybdopterin converting factor subunit 1